MTDSTVHIQGAGPVGLLTALFLLKFGWDKDSIELIDPAIHSPEPSFRNDPRVLALSHGTLVRLSQLGIDPQATRIKEIRVSSEGHFGSMQINTDRVGVSDLGGLAHYSALLGQLRETVNAVGLRIQPQSTAAADVVVIAEGGIYSAAVSDGNSGANANSDSFGETNNAMELVRDYGQHALLGWVTTTPPPGDTAWERFTADGVVALLPLGGRYALIWCCNPQRAEAFTNASQVSRAQLLDEVMGGRISGINAIELTGTYPLGLKWRETVAQGHTVWIGNSAQTLHPIAGQGLNLGFRDAQTLASCLVQRGVTITERLADYARRRRVDRWAVRTATDTLARQAWVRRAIGGVAFVPGAKRLLGQVLMYGG